MNKVIAIIQARMGSTRLPGKMLMDIGGKPAVQHVFERVRLAKTINEIWLATTDNVADDVLASWGKEFGATVFRGSEQDVLDRYYQTAKKAGANVVVRVTADCPLVDPAVIDQVVEAYLGGDFDYVSNVHPPTFPDGLDIEVFSFSSLERAWHEAKLPSEREHVTPYIWKHPELFRLFNVTCYMVHEKVDLSRHRWTLDTPEDLELIRRIVIELQQQGNSTDMYGIIHMLEAHPDWLAVNAQFERNEGYKKSLVEDVSV